MVIIASIICMQNIALLKFAFPISSAPPLEKFRLSVLTQQVLMNSCLNHTLFNRLYDQKEISKN